MQDPLQRGSRRSRKQAGTRKPTPSTPKNTTSRPPRFTGYNSPNPLPTQAKESAFDALNDISTTLNGEAFSEGLAELYASGTFVSSFDRERFNRVPPMVLEGSTLGIKGPVKIRSIMDNCGMTAEEEAVVDSQFLRHLNCNFISGPFTVEEIEKAAGTLIRTSPMRVIPKASPTAVKKWRIIDNLSAPKTPRGDITSVNWNLDSSFETCTWTSNADLEARFLQYGPEVTVMGIDLIEGFMHLPIAPSSRPHFCLNWRGGIYVRKVANFGCRTTPAVFGNAVDATLAIMKNRFPVTAFSQVDDVGVGRTGSEVSDRDVRDFLRSLGWQVHPEEADKGFTWTRLFKHNSVIWDLDSKTKTLSDDKRLKYLAFTTALHEAGTATLADMKKLLGYFIYVCSIAREMKSTLFYLFQFRRSFVNPRGTRTLNRLHRDPMQTWINFLSQPTITRSFELPPSTFPTAIYTDASNQGIGVVAGIFIAGFALRKTWREDFDAHIGPAKAWGVELGLEVAIMMGATNCYLEIFCDNLGVVWSWRKGWSRSKLQNEAIARLTELTMKHGILLHLTYVESALNPADEPSRGIFPSHYIAFPVPPSDPYGTFTSFPPPLIQLAVVAVLRLNRRGDATSSTGGVFALKPGLPLPNSPALVPSQAVVNGGFLQSPVLPTAPSFLSSSTSPEGQREAHAVFEARFLDDYIRSEVAIPPLPLFASAFTLDDVVFASHDSEADGASSPDSALDQHGHSHEETGLDSVEELDDDFSDLPPLVEFDEDSQLFLPSLNPISAAAASEFLTKYQALITSENLPWESSWFPVVEKTHESAIEELATLLERAELLKNTEGSTDDGAPPMTLPPTRNSEKPRPTANNTQPLAADSYRTPVDLSRDIRSGDIIVPESFSVGWSWIDPTPPSDRFDPLWLKETRRQDRLFLLGPAVEDASAVRHPLEVHQGRMVTFAAAITRKTLEAYGGIVLRFVDWCWDKYEAKDIFPCQVPIVLGFVTAHGGKYRLGTLQKWVSAFKWWSSLHGFDFSPPPHEWCSCMRGLEALQPPGMKIREPVTIEDVTHYISQLDVSGENPRPIHVCLQSCVLTSFAAMARLGETTSEKRAAVAKGKSPTIDDVKFIFGDESTGTPAHAIIHLPFDKVKGAAGRDLTILQQTSSPELNPLAALVRHISVNDPPPGLHLFSYRTDKDPNEWVQLTKSFALQHFNEILAKADPPRGPYNGHAFRAGGATYFLKARINPDIIRAIGSWKSDSFLRYWRETLLIAARTMADLKLTSTEGLDLHIDELFNSQEGGDDGSEDIAPKTLTTRRPRGVELEGASLIVAPEPKRLRSQTKR
ncbi:hypothetical protein P7C70_g7412, partial [Phenoliferia sp. Uapishka_3]